jgi:hypothetical protein
MTEVILGNHGHTMLRRIALIAVLAGPLLAGGCSSDSKSPSASASAGPSLDANDPAERAAAAREAAKKFGGSGS